MDRERALTEEEAETLKKAHIAYVEMFRPGGDLDVALLVQHVTASQIVLVPVIRLEPFVPPKVRRDCEREIDAEATSEQTLEEYWCGENNSTPFAISIRQKTVEHKLVELLAELLTITREFLEGERREISEALFHRLRHSDHLAKVEEGLAVCLRLKNTHFVEGTEESLQNQIELARLFQIQMLVSPAGYHAHESPNESESAAERRVRSLDKSYHSNLHPRYKIARWKGF
ncbi:hypothetical protein T439DRAFT_359332 [Meredithblackwellia eburnea MCA 4105]